MDSDLSSGVMLSVLSVSSRNEIKGGQIIILLNFLVKITNITQILPIFGHSRRVFIVPPIPPSGGNTGAQWLYHNSLKK
jgi:hypothetical protein